MLNFIDKHPFLSGLAGVIISFLLKILIAISILPFMKGNLPTQHIPNSVLLVWLISLPLETLLGQALLCHILKKYDITAPIQVILISALFFAFLHSFSGIAVSVILLGPSMVFLTLWVAYRQISFARAFIGVTIVHYFHNALALVFN